MARKGLKSTMTPPVKPGPYFQLPDNPVSTRNFSIITKSKLERRKQYGSVNYLTTLIVKMRNKKMETKVKKFHKNGPSHRHNVEDLVPRVKEYLTNIMGNVVVIPKLL